MNPTAVVAYLLLFAGTAFALVFAALLIGRLVRPRLPNPEKAETYECGEPTIGPGFVQFDLRFYVVALLFIVFDVEAAFFFPWATVFGTATRASDPAVARQVAAALGETPREAPAPVDSLGAPTWSLRSPGGTVEETAARAQTSFRNLARMAMIDMAVFFGALLVGFAYVWRQGDLDWVRAIGASRAEEQALEAEAAAVTRR